MSDSLQPMDCNLPLCPWDSPGKNTGVGCHALFQGIFWPRDRTFISCISCIAGKFFTHWSTKEALSSSLNSTIWHLCWEVFVEVFPGNNFLLVCWFQWQTDGETVADFNFGGSKITVDGDSSHEIKRCLLLRRKVMTNLDSILKSRDIILPTKVQLVKAMAFPVVMHGCESGTIKKADKNKNLKKIKIKI